MDLHTHVIIIGAGISGLCTAIQLIRQYGTRNILIIEKSQQIGGTWSANTYPGCGCDVPSHFYSYSFAPNPNWSQKFALQPEIQSYLEGVADLFELKQHIQFESMVNTARWDEKTGTWLVEVYESRTKRTSLMKCKILVSAVGGLSTPKKCNLPGIANFKGLMFHSAEWDHTFNWSGKNVVVIGNGCSATQFVPVISDSPGGVQKITQFANQAHWLAERPNPSYSVLSKWTMRWVPWAQLLYRAKIYWDKEKDFRAFGIESGAPYRANDSVSAAKYIRENAPAKYHDFLVPKTQIGCKRRVNDTNYLACLHRQNVDLVYDDPIQEILVEGVRTVSGKIVPADAIVLATGFETQKALWPMVIYGKGGESLQDHWQKVSNGSPSAYLGTCVAGFPNFFIMMGPNTLSGHLSVIYTTECQVNFAMRVIRPLVRSLEGTWGLKQKADSVCVTPEAERRDLNETQRKAKNLVWATGCSSWFIDTATGRNTIMFPDYQYKFWWRSVWVKWSDFAYGNL